MPLTSQVHVNRVLTNLSIAFANNMTDLIGLQLAPRVRVGKTSDTFFKYDADVFLRTHETDRAEGDHYKRIEWGVSTDSYTAVQHGLEDAIDDKTKRNADSPLDLPRDSVEILTQRIMLGWEQEIATALTTAANFATGHNATLSGTSQWSDFNGSDPFTDIDTGIETVHTKTALMPNTMAMGKQVWRQLKNHPDFLNRLADNSIRVLNPGHITEIFDSITTVLIGSAVRETAAEGATSSVQYVWGKDVVLGYVEPSPGVKKPSLAYTFTPQDLVTEEYREDPIDSDVYRVKRESVSKFVANQAGYVIKAAVA